MIDCENFSCSRRVGARTMRSCAAPASVSSPPPRSGRSASSAGLASDAGADTATTLLVRFGLAALVFAAVLAWTGGWRALRGLSRRVVLTGLALGAAGYSLQSGLYFAAIGRLDVSLVALLLYTYPAFVTIAALALGRLTPSPRIGAALALASAGLVLVLVAAGTGAFDVTGALMAIGASLTYTTYILVSDGIVGDIEPFALALLVLTGATVTSRSRAWRPGRSTSPSRPRRGCGWC